MRPDLDHKKRSNGIGSSEIAMLLGISPWGGPHRLWRKKLKLEKDEHTSVMRRGVYLERAILDWYSDEHGVELSYPGTIRHPDYPWVVDTVDAIVVGVRCVEAKTRHKDWGGEVPLYYQAQCQWHMGCHDLDLCDVPVDTGWDFETLTVERDRELFEKMVEIARVFWINHIETKIPPPLDQDAATSKWLNANVRQNTDRIRVATNDEVALLMQYRNLKLAQKEIAEFEVRIKEAIGNDDGLNIDGTDAVVTWRENAKGKRILRSTRLLEAPL